MDELNKVAEEAGARHADRVIAILNDSASDVSQEIIDLATSELEKGLTRLEVALRRTPAPEGDVIRCIETIRAAYAKRLAEVLLPAAGSA